MAPPGEALILRDQSKHKYSQMFLLWIQSSAARLGVLGLSLLFFLPVQASTEQQQLAGSISLTPFMEVLADPGGQLGIDDVSGGVVAEQLQPVTQDIFNAGFTSTPHWFRISLPPQTALKPSSKGWHVVVNSPLLDKVDFYLPDPESGWAVSLMGDQRPFSERPVPHRYFVQPVDLHPDQPTVIYLRLMTESSLEAPLTLVTDEHLWQSNHTALMVIGGYYGLIVGMLLYNILFYMTIRDRVYTYYLLTMIFAGLLVPLSMDGFGTQYLWGEYPYWVNISTPLGLTATLFWASIYTRAFFEQRALVPTIDWIVKAFIAIDAVAVVLVFFLPHIYSILIGITMATLGTILIGVMTQQLILKGDRSAKVYALAFTPMMLCSMVKTLETMDLLPSNLFTINSLQIGQGFAVIGLSLVLADKYNFEREEHIRVSRLKRFFSPEVATAITADGGDELLQPTRRYVVVVFTDMRGFTAFAARTEPDEVLRVLREYHEVATRTVSQHQGTLEHFVGDGVMVCFNTPVQVDNPEQRALEMVLDLHRQFAELHAQWLQRGHSLGIGIGMAAGEATVGVVGEEERQDYTTIGTVANLSSRLCDLARHGEILVAGTLHEKLADMAKFQDIGKQFVKGIPEPVLIYKMLP